MRIAVLLTAIATPAIAHTQEFDHMGWGYGHGVGMIFGPVLWLIVLGLVVAGVIWLFRRLDVPHGPQSRSNALSELDMRFARGEIDEEEYTSRKRLLNS